MVSEIFHVNNNAFSGTIPAQLGSLASAREMKFNSNRLSGSIPDEFGSLSALGKLCHTCSFCDITAKLFTFTSSDMSF